MESRTETITPSKAETYLNRNKINRKLRDGGVEKYAADMLAGAWTECLAPIAFYNNGDIADGQHRLWAVVQSGKAQKFSVVRGVPKEAGLNIDTGMPRDLIDNARISGRDVGLNRDIVAAARGIQEGERQNKALSNTAKLAYVEQHRDAATWAASHGPRGRGVRNQVVLAAVARAWYKEADKEKLARFCSVLSTGFADGDQESAAVAFRNYLLSKSSAHHINVLWRENFLKTMNAIKYFMQGKKLLVIRNVAEEAYPLPKQAKSKEPQ